MVSLLPSSKISIAIIHRFNEAEVLRHVHFAHSEDVIKSDGTPVCSGGRQKKRIGLVEYGRPFMNLKTPLEALKVTMIYLRVSLNLTCMSSF